MEVAPQLEVPSLFNYIPSVEAKTDLSPTQSPASFSAKEVKQSVTPLLRFSKKGKPEQSLRLSPSTYAHLSRG